MSLRGHHGLLLAGAAPVLWTPAHLATPPYMWFNDDSPMILSGDRVTEWGDISGNGYHMANVSPGATTRPLRNSYTLNGRPTVYFAGSNVRLWNNSIGARDVFANQTAGWILIVYRWPAVGGTPAKTMFSVGSGSTAGSGRFFANSSQASSHAPAIVARRLDADSAAILQGVGLVETDFRMVLYRIDWANGDGFIHIDGGVDVTNAALTSSGATSNTTSVAAVMMGAFATSTGATPTIAGAANYVAAEKIIGRGDLDQDEIDRLFGYVAHRWDLTARLDVGHPFKIIPPTV